jgi:hypothetical protein
LHYIHAEEDRERAGELALTALAVTPVDSRHHFEDDAVRQRTPCYLVGVLPPGPWHLETRPSSLLGLLRGIVVGLLRLERRILLGTSTTSQAQKGACGLNSTAPVGPSWRHLAVGPIPPADWGTRSTRSPHLGKRPEHEVLIF